MAADAIVRLKVDSKEYDSKIARAQSGLLALERSCRETGKSMNSLTDDQMEYIKSLGNMQTVSTTTKGKLRELTSAYTEFHTIYQRMDEAEKNGEGGKALAASLDQLKGRIQNTKQELSNATEAMSDNEKKSKSLKDSLNDLAGKFGLNINQLSAVGVAYGVAKGAAEVFNKTVEATENTADAYATIQMQVNSVVNGFFRALAEGDFSSFLGGLANITESARAAYEALDNLESFSVRYNPKNAADMQKVDKLLKEAAALKAKGDNSGALAKTQEAQALANQMKENTRAYGRMETSTGLAVIRNKMSEAGVSVTDKQIYELADPKNFQRLQQLASEYENIQKKLDALAGSSVIAHSQMSGAGTRGSEISSERAALQARITPEMRRAYAYMNSRDNDQAFVNAHSQIYGNQRADTAIDAIDARIMRREGMIQGASSAATAKEPKAIAYYDESMLTKFQTQMEGSAAQGAEIPASLRETFVASIEAQFETDSNAAANEMHSQIQEEFENLDPFNVKVETNSDEVKKQVQAVALSAQTAATVVSSIGAAFNAIEDPAAKVAGTVAQAIATVAAGYAAASLQAAQMGGPWAWIAFAATGLATMISMVSAIHEQTGYQYGGIVEGNSYSGDNIPANGGTIGLNAGELVLTKAQQGNLASQLTGSDGLHLSTEVSGENLRLVLARNNARKGYEDTLTFNM